MDRQRLYTLAMRRVEQRRQAAEIEAQARREALLQDHPRLREITEAKGAAGAQAAALAAQGRKEEAAKKLAEMKRLAREYNLLHKGKDFKNIEPCYSCPICNDTGKHEGAMCRCVAEEMRRMRREEINQSGALQLHSFENFSLEKYPQRVQGVNASPREVMAKNLAYCKSWVESFGPKAESILMFGDAGLGKTHLALSMAGAILEQGYDVIYVSAQTAFAQVAAERFDGEGGMFTSMLEAELLVLDDLGTEYLDAYLMSKMYELVNGRMAKRPTIYTTNIYKQDQFNQRYTEKIASRLLGQCHPMRFMGNDIRLQK